MSKASPEFPEWPTARPTQQGCVAEQTGSPHEIEARYCDAKNRDLFEGIRAPYEINIGEMTNDTWGRRSGNTITIRYG